MNEELCAHPAWPVLTPSQELELRIQSDRRNIDDIGPATPNGTVRDIIVNCSVRFLDAKKNDARVGGCEFERKALENMNRAIRAYAART